MNDLSWFFAFAFSSFLFGFIGDNSYSRFVSFFCFLLSICNAICSVILAFRYLF